MEPPTLGIAQNPGASISMIIGAYLLGSIATAILVSKIMGLPDPRAGGSGNPGATNVLRLGGKKAALFTLAGDLLKGLVPVLIAKMLGADATVLIAVAIAAFLGHLYPVFFGFAGGKGAATALGVLAGLSWLIGGAVLVTWLLVMAATRYASLSALVAAICAPIYAYFLTDTPSAQIPMATGTLFIALLLVWRHRGNIARLLDGSEDRVGRKKMPASQ